MIWLGEDDPCVTRSRVDSNDIVQIQLKSVSTAWWNLFGNKPMLVKDVVDECCNENITNQALYEALFDVAGEGNSINKRKLGRWLSRMEGRIANKKKLSLDPDSPSNRKKWRVVEAI